MKKSLIIILSIVGFVVLMFMYVVGAYNSLVRMDEAINGSWAQVENVYQRRADLIPNLVETVKGYAKHESETFEMVVNARAKATSVTLSADALKDPVAFQNFQKAQGDLSSSLGRLLAVSENYPNLKANENFLQLQAQLEGSENRIAVERKYFNSAVQSFNAKIKTFPTNLIAGFGSFSKRPYFEAEKGAEVAPEVKF